MTVPEESFMKTEYIYVLGADGKPQMPTKRKRHVIRLLNTGMARLVEKVPFTIQLKYKNHPVLQPVILAEDPGRTNIGVAALSSAGDLLFAAVVETRNKEIKKLMADRKGHRQASRRGERKNRQRLARKYKTMVQSGMIMRKLPQYGEGSFITCKWIRNKEARFCNRKRKPDWITPTVRHLVQTHLNLVKKIKRYLPISDVAFEVNRFAFVRMEKPEAFPVEIGDINGNSYAMGFITPHAAEELQYEYGQDSELGQFISLILDDMNKESEDGTYIFNNLRIWMNRDVSKIIGMEE